MRFPIGKAMPFLNALRTIRAQLSSHAIVLPSCDRPSPHPPTAIALLHTSPKAIAFPHLPNTIAPLLIHLTRSPLPHPPNIDCPPTAKTCDRTHHFHHMHRVAIALLKYPKRDRPAQQTTGNRPPVLRPLLAVALPHLPSFLHGH